MKYKAQQDVTSKTSVNPPFLKMRFVPHCMNQLQVPVNFIMNTKMEKYITHKITHKITDEQLGAVSKYVKIFLNRF